MDIVTQVQPHEFELLEGQVVSIRRCSIPFVVAKLRCKATANAPVLSWQAERQIVPWKPCMKVHVNMDIEP